MIRIITTPINCALHRAINVLDRLTRGEPEPNRVLANAIRERTKVREDRDAYAEKWASALIRIHQLSMEMRQAADALDAITRDADRTIVAGALHDEITALAQRLRDAARGM